MRVCDDPCLHSDTLEDCQHGEANVVKRRDPVVGSLPLLCTERHREVAGVGSTRGRGQFSVIARNLSGALRNDLICKAEFKYFGIFGVFLENV